MLGNLSGWHFLIIIAVVVLLFGAPKLPGLAKSLGQSLRIFRGEMKQMKDDSAEAKNTEASGSDSSAPNSDAPKNS
jgi:sec-independent protein translocase protein TatA